MRLAHEELLLFREGRPERGVPHLHDVEDPLVGVDRVVLLEEDLELTRRVSVANSRQR